MTSIERQKWRATRDIPSGARVACFVGRLESAKGLEVLEALAPLLLQTDWYLVIEYPRSKSVNYREIARRISEVAEDRVRLIPHQDQSMPRPVCFSDVLISPSLSEVAPLVVIEALLCGVPCIVTNATPWYQELLDEGLGNEHLQVINLPHFFMGGHATRAKLKLDTEIASRIAKQVLDNLRELEPFQDADRFELSRSAAQHRLRSEDMIQGLQEVYDRAERMPKVPFKPVFKILK